MCDTKNIRKKYKNWKLNRILIKWEQYENYTKERKIILVSKYLKQIPSWIRWLKELEILGLYYNNIQKIPSLIGELKKLKVLNLNNNNIKEIPSEIKELKDLEILILYHNNIQEIPIEILKKCDSLKEVWLGGDLIPKEELERANEELNIRIIYRTF